MVDVNSKLTAWIATLPALILTGCALSPDTDGGSSADPPAWQGIVAVTGNVFAWGSEVELDIIFVPKDGSTPWPRALVDDHGDYAFDMRKAGRYRAVVYSDCESTPWKLLEFDVEVAAEESALVDFYMPQGRVFGQLFDRAGRALENVPVRLAPDGPLPIGSPTGGAHQRVMSGPDGRYTFSKLPAGTYTVTAGGGAHGRVARHGIQMGAGASPDDVDIELPPGARLEGQVVDAAGRPVANASVFLWGADGRAAERVAPATSDSEGFFVIDGVSPGSYSAAALGDAAASATLGPLEVGADRSNRIRLVTAPAASLQIELPEDGGTTAVSVRDAEGREFHGLLPRSVGSLPAVGLSETGLMMSRLPPGRYQVRALRADGATLEQAVTLVDGHQRLRLSGSGVQSTGRPVEGRSSEAPQR